MLFVEVRSTHAENLSQPLQTKKKQFKIAVTFLTGYNAIFTVTYTKNKRIYFLRSINYYVFSKISLSTDAFEIESLNNENEEIFIEEGFFAEANYPFTTKANFSSLCSFIEILSNITGSHMVFTLDDSMRDLLGFKRVIVHEESSLSDKAADTLPFEIISFETDRIIFLSLGK